MTIIYSPLLLFPSELWVLSCYLAKSGLSLGSVLGIPAATPSFHWMCSCRLSGLYLLSFHVWRQGWFLFPSHQSWKEPLPSCSVVSVSSATPVLRSLGRRTLQKSNESSFSKAVRGLHTTGPHWCYLLPHNVKFIVSNRETLIPPKFFVCRHSVPHE